jgi:hypothetical protein
MLVPSSLQYNLFHTSSKEAVEIVEVYLITGTHEIWATQDDFSSIREIISGSKETGNYEELLSIVTC